MTTRHPLQGAGTATTAQPLLTGLDDLAPASVTVVGNAYRVDWGPGVRPRFHHVAKNKTCRCALGPACPSVLRVREYLDAGGERAPDYPDDFWPTVPEQCPICGNPCQPHPPLDFAAHGLGWTCATAGTLHYWEARLLPIRRAIQARADEPRWVIPPAYGPKGEMVYAGVTIADMRAARLQAQISNPRWRSEGYCPWD